MDKEIIANSKILIDKNNSKKILELSLNGEFYEGNDKFIKENSILKDEFSVAVDSNEKMSDENIFY